MLPPNVYKIAVGMLVLTEARCVVEVTALHPGDKRPVECSDGRRYRIKDVLCIGYTEAIERTLVQYGYILDCVCTSTTGKCKHLTSDKMAGGEYTVTGKDNVIYFSCLKYGKRIDGPAAYQTFCDGKEL